MLDFPHHLLSTLTLGTVQLGMPYGVAVQTRPPDQAHATQLLNAAWRAGITCFDTARAYGEAEVVLGNWIQAAPEPVTGPLLVSKFAPIPETDPAAFVRRSLGSSCQALGRDRIDAYLAHRADDIALPGVADTLRALRAEGKINAFGVSVYEPAQLERALEYSGVSVVQVPASLLDQRFHESGLLDRCGEKNVTVFARSLFLQGVLFLEPKKLPHYLNPAARPIAGLRNICGEIGCSLASLAMAAVISMPGVSSAVIGVADQAQLNSNLEAFSHRIEPGAVAEALKLCRGLPTSLIDPRQWRQAPTQTRVAGKMQ